MTEYYQGTPMEKLPQIKRMEFVERDLRDHAKSLTSLTDQLGQASMRISALEKVDVVQEVAQARQEERDKALNSRLTTIESDIRSIKGAGSKLLFIVGTSVVGAFVLFVIKGGLNI